MQIVNMPFNCCSLFLTLSHSAPAARHNSVLPAMPVLPATFVRLQSRESMSIASLAHSSPGGEDHSSSGVFSMQFEDSLGGHDSQFFSVVAVFFNPIIRSLSPWHRYFSLRSAKEQFFINPVIRKYSS